MTKPLTPKQRQARIKKALDHTEAAVVALSPIYADDEVLTTVHDRLLDQVRPLITRYAAALTEEIDGAH